MAEGHRWERVRVAELTPQQGLLFDSAGRVIPLHRAVKTTRSDCRSGTNEYAYNFEASWLSKQTLTVVANPRTGKVSVTCNDQRIVSLIPSATEWVCELGLRDRLVGISHECDFPADVDSLPRVTRSRIAVNGQSSREIDEAVRSHSESKTPLYELDGDTLRSLRPDLILTQSLCNVCAVSERDVLRSVSNLHHRCHLLDLRAQTFEEVLSEGTRISEATGDLTSSISANESLRARVSDVRQAVSHVDRRPSVTLLEWVDPMFCAGHWTPQLIEWAGGDDPIGRTGHPSRTISPQELLAADPDILLIACCGLDLERTKGEQQILERLDGWGDLKCVKSHQVYPFDGSAYFNRPGPRLVDALESVAGVIARWRESCTGPLVEPSR